MRVGFIGLGNIGAPMARRLCARAFDVTVHDADAGALEAFAGLPCRRSATVSDTARDLDVVGICVRDDAQLEDVVTGRGGLAAALPRGAIVLVHSTIRPATIRALQQAAPPGDITFLDAPVTGGAHLAEQGRLTTMAGGPAWALERARPVLEAHSSQIVHAGWLGAGMTLKAANNLVTMLELVAAHESFRLVERCGLDAGLLRDVMASNGNLTDTMRRFLDFRRDGARQLGAAEFEAFQTRMGRLVTKDLEVALAIADDAGLELPATAAAAKLMIDVFMDRGAGAAEATP